LKHLASLKHLAKEVICIIMWLKHPCNFSLIPGNEPVQFSFNPNKWICVSSSIIRFTSTRGGETFDNYIPCRACWGIINQWCREALNAVWKYLLEFGPHPQPLTFHITLLHLMSIIKLNRWLDVVKSKFGCIFFISKYVHWLTWYFTFATL
jgi:hypothetical protein